MKHRTFRAWRWLLIGLFLALIAGIGIGIYVQNTTGERVTTSIAAPAPEPPREIESTTIDSTGHLILTFSDGSVTNVGRVVGTTGATGEGQYPTREQLDEAVDRYCIDGRCDANDPTETQVLAAVSLYCAGGTCRGEKGERGAAPTAEQLQAAVLAYCADGRCRGANGTPGAIGATGETGATGAQGERGISTQMACVQRVVNNLATRFVAWKYQDETDSAYRNIYQLPAWAQCTNPVVLNEAA